MWIARECENTLRSLFEQFPSVAVTGARQAGKTALVRRVFPDADYISLDLPALAYQAERSGEAFLRSRKEPLIIDEVQYAPSLFRYVKDLIDKDRRPGRFILTGSQHFLMMQGVSESLAAFLLGFESWEGVARHPAMGPFWETHVVMEVVKYRTSLGKAWPLWFWRTAQGDEVDLLLERDGRFIAIEAKSAESIDQKDLKGIRAFKRDYGEESMLEGFVAGRIAASYPLGDRLSAIPAGTIHDVLGKFNPR